MKKKLNRRQAIQATIAAGAASAMPPVTVPLASEISRTTVRTVDGRGGAVVSHRIIETVVISMSAVRVYPIQPDRRDTHEDPHT